MRRSICIFTVGYLLAVPCVAIANDFLTLSDVQFAGTTRLSTEDVIRGLGLRVGEPTTRQGLIRPCQQLGQLKLFASSRCRYHIEGQRASLVILVKDTQGGLPIVFDNFAWMTRAELLSRLKRELPLFMPELPESSGLTSDIIRVLGDVAAEHGIKARVRYDDRFWTIRGMNVFFLEGISTPITSLEIQGENAPSKEEVRKWAQFYTKENFSAARLTWVIRWVIRDFYFSRGYMRPVVGRPVVQCLGERDGAFPVRVFIPITPGDVYTFELVKFKGLAEVKARLLLQEWKLRPGDPYDERYTNSFVSQQILSAPWAQHSETESDTANSCAKVDETNKKVSVIISVAAPKRTYRAKEGESCGGVTKFLEYPPVP